MIPDFKTYIKESIWSDMQDRGTGDITKKEDDIDLMDEKELYEYIHKSYEAIVDVKTNDMIYYINAGDGTYFYIVVGCVNVYHKIWNIYFRYEYSVNAFSQMEMDYVVRNIIGDNLNQVGKNYKIKRLDGGDYVFTPTEGKYISNKDVIELIDNVLKSVDEPIIRKIEK